MIRLLFCDDDANHRREYQARLGTAWVKLVEMGLIADGLQMETCSDIAEVPTMADGRALRDLGAYDAFLLDIIWRMPGGTEEPKGVQIAQMLRGCYPEKHILMFTESADSSFFHDLVEVNICAYLRKGDSFLPLCLQIYKSIERARRVRNVQAALYKEIRLRTMNDGWAAQSVDRAATNIWLLERSHDRWDAFWKAFSAPIARHRLNLIFQKMTDFFQESDLLMLGTLPGMRGHLEHVLNVYFTGYVITNTGDRFKRAALAAARLLFSDVIDEEHHWDMFQLAWLAAATLHDTAYPLELQPDLLARCSAIRTDFSDIFDGEDSSHPEPNPGIGRLRLKGIDEMGHLLNRLYGHSRFTALIRDNSTFQSARGPRVNHGVASALLFLSLADQTALMKNQPDELSTYLCWAAAAMALHSLKRPGSESGVTISLDKDPLSYLLLACDEIQVWERERPDVSKKKSPFKATELSQFAVSDEGVTAAIAYIPYEGASFEEDVSNLNVSIGKDGIVLAKYMDGGPFKIAIDRGIPSQGISMSSLHF